MAWVGAIHPLNQIDWEVELAVIIGKAGKRIARDRALAPGDIISTGTPAGVGIFRDPPVVLQAGDVVECRIEKIGTIRNRLVETIGSAQ